MTPNAHPLEPRWARVLALVLFALVLTAYAWWPMLTSYPATQNGDGEIIQHYIEATRISVLRWHELPLWDPYQCSGLPLWDNPENVGGSPIAWASFLLGGTRTIHVWILLHVAAGFVGMWLLARHELGLSRTAALVAAGAWAFAGVHTQHYAVGHLALVGFELFPLALLLWRRAVDDLRCAVGLGMLLAFMFYEGAVYPLPQLLVVLVAESFTRAWPWRRVLLLLRAAGVVGLVAATLAASRLLPVFVQVTHHHRDLVDVDALGLSALGDMFFRRTPPNPPSAPLPGLAWSFHEYGAYLGPIVVALAIVGIASAGRRRIWMLALLAFTFALMLGHVGRLAPWHILHAHVPPFSEMRVPSRWRASVVLFLAAYAGIGIDRLAAFLDRFFHGRARDAAKVAVIGVALLGVGDIVSVGIDVVRLWFTSPPSAPGPVPVRLYYGGPDMPPLVDVARRNRARFECKNEWGFGVEAHRVLWAGDEPQARATDDGAVVEVANRTQNTFTIDVDVKRPTRIAIDSAYDPGWRTDVGTIAEQNEELMLDLPAPGHYRVHLRYWPHGLTAGMIITALGAIGTVAYWLRVRAKRENEANRE